MTLEVFTELEQGTTAWLEARRGVLTASVIGKVITPKTIKVASNDTSRDLMTSLVAERITGRIEPVHVTREMERGTFEEPIARGYYEEATGFTVDQIGFMRLDEDSFTLGYSPDGLVGLDGLIEIKSRGQKKHLKTILEDAVPLENMAQIQCGLFVSGRDWCDYVSFCGGMPLLIKRVWIDERWVDAIQQAARSYAKFTAQTEAVFHSVTQASLPTEPSHFDDLEEIAW